MSTQVSAVRIDELVARLCAELLTNTEVPASLRAAVIYKARQERIVHPDGSFDGAGRFYAGESENFPHHAYRAPSRRFKYSQMVACRSLPHVTCRLLGLPEHNVLPARRLSRQMWEPLFEQCAQFLPGETLVRLGLLG